MSDDLVQVKTWLPAPMYRRLYAAAAKHGSTVDAMVAECVRRVLANDLTPTPVRKVHRRKKWTAADTEQLFELHGQGLIDSVIAKRMGRPVSTVFKRREGARLLANRAPMGRPASKDPAA